MKRIAFFALAMVFVVTPAVAGDIYVVDYEYQADVKVYVVDYEYQADLNVFYVDYEYQAAGKDELWYVVDYEYQADVKV
jgi:capsular polysaccharide biosynthesis protein